MTIQEIRHEIEQLEPAEVNFRNVQVLASLYIIRENLSIPHTSEKIPVLSGNSEFFRAVSGKSIKDVMAVFDELMEAIQITNPRLYVNVIQKLKGGA